MNPNAPVWTPGGSFTPRPPMPTREQIEAESALAPAAKIISLGASAPAKPAPPSSPLPSAETPPAAPAPAPKATHVENVINTVADRETIADLYRIEGEDVLPGGKEHLNVVFIGHVDAGKSTMGGQLLFLTGMVDKRTMEKYEKEAKEAGRESWYLSWALDSSTQERAKGKTVEMGRAYFESSIRRYTILDAPGHKTFVPSMITGAAQADVAALVISARKGEFETGFEKGGQTREHVMLVKTAGVGKLVVVINKMDEATVNWDKERFDEIVGKLSPFIKASGFNLKTDVTFIPVSAYTAANMVESLTPGLADWYKGPSLVQYLDQLPTLNRNVNAPLMIPISEKYRDMGTVVVGKIESGRVRKGDQILMMPNKVSVEVVSILSENEEEDLPIAICGDNIRLRLRGIDDADVSPGFILTSPQNPVQVVTKFEAIISVVEVKNIICAGYSAVMHAHTLSEEIQIEALLHYYDKKTGRRSKKAPQFAKKGMKVMAIIATEQPICLEEFSNQPQLGRFTIRDEGVTVAIGRVTKCLAREETVEGALAESAAELADSKLQTGLSQMQVVEEE